MTYQELAKAFYVLPPHSIHRVTEALERLMEEDAAANRPFIATLAISQVRGGLPAPGFFEFARHLGRFADRHDARVARPRRRQSRPPRSRLIQLIKKDDLGPIRDRLGDCQPICGP
jgi:hypothetical protein